MAKATASAAPPTTMSSDDQHTARVIDILGQTSRVFRAYRRLSKELIREETLQNLYAARLEDHSTWTRRTDGQMGKLWGLFSETVRRILWMEAALYLLGKKHDTLLREGFDLLHSERPRSQLTIGIIELWNDRVMDMVYEFSPTPGQTQRNRMRERGQKIANATLQWERKVEVCIPVDAWLFALATKQEATAVRELGAGSKHLATKRQQLEEIKARQTMLQDVLPLIIKVQRAYQSRVVPPL